MAAPASVEIEPGTSGCPLLLPGLPGCVVIGAFVSVLPIALFSHALLVIVHLPTFVALLEPAVVVSCRAQNGERASPIAIAAIVGGLVASVSLMMIPAAMVGADRECAWNYWFTWILVPVVGLAGTALAAGLAATLVGFAWLARRWKARGQRSGSASCF